MKKLERQELEKRVFRKALSEIKPIPGFDSMKWLRKVRAKIYKETKDMTSEEVCEYYRQASERMQKEREQFWAEQVRLAESGGSEIEILHPDNVKQ